MSIFGCLIYHHKSSVLNLLSVWHVCVCCVWYVCDSWYPSMDISKWVSYVWPVLKLALLPPHERSHWWDLITVLSIYSAVSSHKVYCTSFYLYLPEIAVGTVTQCRDNYMGIIDHKIVLWFVVVRHPSTITCSRVSLVCFPTDGVLRGKIFSFSLGAPICIYIYLYMHFSFRVFSAIIGTVTTTQFMSTLVQCH